jgi:transposase
MLPASVRIFVCTVPQDMRRSFDSLALAARELLGEDPQSGALYIFIGKRPTRIKALWWDRNGYCLLYKRLHRAIFRLPQEEGAGSSLRIDGQVLAELLAGVQCEKKHTKTLTARLH